jgi:hypothetical protein
LGVLSAKSEARCAGWDFMNADRVSHGY